MTRTWIRRNGDDVKPIVRWPAAGLVTVATFAVATWGSGALILPVIMKDAAIRWGVAGALGVAVAALAALWGHSFATAGKPSETASGGDPDAAPGITATGSGDTRSEIRGGTFHGPVVQGRDVSGPVAPGAAPLQYSSPETQEDRK